MRDWVMDSGAFSAHNSGSIINLDAFIAECRQLLSSDKMLREVYSLDVIGDWKASLINTEKIWAAGIEAIPCYHYGEPESVLTELSGSYPKIAIGGAVGLPKSVKIRWATQCFARVWPKKIHGFGFGSPDYIRALPFHSVDCSDWQGSAMRFGRWFSYGNKNIGIRCGFDKLRPEVETVLKWEREAWSRWRATFRELGWLQEEEQWHSRQLIKEVK